MNGDIIAEVYGDICDIYERAVWGPYDPDDGFKHTSDLARELADSIVHGVLVNYARSILGATDDGDGDAALDDLLCGIRVQFDWAVTGAELVAAGHAPGCHCFQPDLESDAFAPCETYGGDSVRANDVAVSVAALIGCRPGATDG